MSPWPRDDLLQIDPRVLQNLLVTCLLTENGHDEIAIPGGMPYPGRLISVGGLDDDSGHGDASPLHFCGSHVLLLDCISLDCVFASFCIDPLFPHHVFALQNFHLNHPCHVSPSTACS